MIPRQAPMDEGAVVSCIKPKARSLRSLRIFRVGAPPGNRPLTSIQGESTRSALLYGFMGSFLPVAFITVCLRLYSRWRFTHIGKDDALIVVGLVKLLCPHNCPPRLAQADQRAGASGAVYRAGHRDHLW